MLLQAYLYGPKVGEEQKFFSCSNSHKTLPTMLISFLLFPDMWAMGAIMAELFTLRPLFPGARCVAHAHPLVTCKCLMHKSY